MPNIQINKLRYLSRVLGCFIALLVISTSLNAFRGQLIKADEQSITQDIITISATIGTSTHMSIFGYAPPLSKIVLYGTGISTEIQADVKGYFSFDPIYSTGGTRNYPELCLLAYIGTYSTRPTCLPAIQAGTTAYTVGPVVLSPIIYIEQNVFPMGAQVALNGITVPNSDVSIYFEKSGGWFAFISSAPGYSLPPYKIVSDEYGKFQINLPSNTVARWRVHALVDYSSSTSTASSTLNFKADSNVAYYLTKIYETIIKTTKIVAAVVTTTGAPDTITPDGFPNTNISKNEIDIFKYRMPFFAIFIEVLIILFLIIIFLFLRKKKRNRVKKNIS